MFGRVEQGFVAAIVPDLPGVLIRQATSAEPLPSDTQVLIVECPEVEHVAGPLHRANVKIHLRTSSFDDGEARHREVAQSLVAALADAATVADRFDAVSESLRLRGFYQRMQSEEVQQEAWRCTLEIVAGICVG